jgi:ribosomal protein S18 acetylase RimI-like enzyme
MKNKYRELCKKESSIPIFSRDWWLDAVCGETDWNVFIIEKNGSIIGALPYNLTKGPFGLPQIVMPELTQHNGVWIRYPANQNTINKLSYEKEVMTSIIDQIDNMDIAYFNQHFHYSITNWLPFMWRGFQQTTRYTYVLEDLSDPDNLYMQFKGDKRTGIRKASKFLQIRHDLPAYDFYNIHKQALAKQGDMINYSLQLLEKIFQAAYKFDQGKSFYCENAQGKIYGALFIIWDENSAYHFISAFDPEHRSHGIGSFLIWEGIKYVATRTKKFDFEGSIVEKYEHSYRGFGGIQKPYFNIRKTYSPVYMFRDGFNQLNKGFRQGLKDMIGGLIRIEKTRLESQKSARQDSNLLPLD